MGRLLGNSIVIPNEGVDSHSHLPAPGQMSEVPSIPKKIEPLIPPVIHGVSLSERTRDRRSVASKKHDYGERPWTKITGICLHQTACVLGENPERWDSVGCHIGVTRAGYVIRLHDFDRLIVHGNGWNSQCVGIEIDGTYEGIEGDERTLWKGDSRVHAQRPTAEAIEATQQVIRSICDEVSANGGKIKALVAHRQASASRRSDPGSGIWKSIALPMMKELKLTDGGPGFKIGDGLPIPESWDVNRKGIKY